MIELGYATFNNELSDEEIERRKNTIPVYLLTKTGCGWVQRGIDMLQADMNTKFGVDNIVVISGTDLLDKEKLITKLKETPNAYIILSDKTSPIIIPRDISNVISYLEYNINKPESTWELLLNKHRQEYPLI